jgi:hypothetical protein
MILAAGLIALLLAAIPFGLGLSNLLIYRKPAPAAVPPPVSVLIPARNEEANIGPAVLAVLANTGIELEVLVLDDGSTDGTAAVLAGITDPRLRVLSGAPLPEGWCGKQFACATLAREARHEFLVFTDADVRLAPDAVLRMAGFMEQPKLGLASGFPRQITGSWAEQLLLPLIHFLLLGFLPIHQMRRSGAEALGAGCGQLFIVRRAAYDRAGGHGAIRGSLHDGLTLPRAFRRAGQMTGLFDATDLATCRMYASAAEVWSGLGKNATEGMAKAKALPIWTVILLGGQVLPPVLVAAAPSTPAILALVMSIGLRLVLASRFQQSLVSAWLHPLGVLGLLVVQWAALVRAWIGRPSVWRGRAYKPL